MKDVKSWLNYWRNTVADADRKKVKISTASISLEEIKKGLLSKNQTDYLWFITKAKKKDSFINIDIFPFSITESFNHAKQEIKEDVEIIPFCIPARLDQNGNLKPSLKTLPLFIRDYLTPNTKTDFSIASIVKVDSELKKAKFNIEDWENYYNSIDTFFEKVTSKSIQQYYESNGEKAYIQKEILRGLSNNIIKIYDHLIKEDKYGRLFLKIAGLTTTSNINIPTKNKVLINKRHFGQMSSEFPLSVSQRESIKAFTSDHSEVFAVNGPPGTGKTTFLQTILANILITSIVNDSPPQLIIASSTNNQAITNILESFKIDSESSFSERWLPGLTSLGLYFTSSDKKSNYQVLTSTFGDGFFKDYEDNNELETLKLYFFNQYNKHFSEDFTIDSCQKNIKNLINKNIAKINNSLLIAKQFENIPIRLASENFDSEKELDETIKTKSSDIEISQLKQVKLNEIENKVKISINERSLFDKVFFFFPNVKRRKRNSLKRALIEISFDDSIFINSSNESEIFDAINKQVIINLGNLKKQKQTLNKLKELKEKITNIKSIYNELITNWDDKYTVRLVDLHKKTKTEYQDLSPLEDINIRLDISLRFETFWLAIHYREAEYIQLIEDRKRKKKTDKERGEIAYKAKLQRIACLTPIFISTFHSMPKFSTFRKFQAKEDQFYYELYDYLIVDEAGQVAPEIALPSFSLAKKAIVVGDVSQIEPVRSVEFALDFTNLVANNLIDNDVDNETFTKFKNTKNICSSNSLMKSAQNACSFIGYKQRGVLLKEHRRCLDDIISYSNQYVYDNELLPMVGKTHSKNHSLPARGYLNIDSESQSQGSSKVNVKESKIIAHWIDSKRVELEQAYNQNIEEILAVVSPYTAQAYLIKQELLALKNGYKKITVGTVHSLQGAERKIIIFSTVLSKKDKTKFLNKYNMLNVAISRAKHSFLVFGNINILDATKNTPLGNLKKWLLKEEYPELSSSIVFEKIALNKKIKSFEHISTLNRHSKVLKGSIEKSLKELIIVSPFISIEAILKDELIPTLKKAIERGVKIIIITDYFLDKKNGKLKPNSKKGRESLTNAGVKIIAFNGIHSKTIIVDENILIEGSFNWLSAVRDPNSQYAREERSIMIYGEESREEILKAKTKLIEMIKNQ